jgi:hypothetical protein
MYQMNVNKLIEEGYKRHMVMTDKRPDRITRLTMTEFNIFISNDVYIECPIKILTVIQTCTYTYSCVCLHVLHMYISRYSPWLMFTTACIRLGNVPEAK